MRLSKPHDWLRRKRYTRNGILSTAVKKGLLHDTNDDMLKQSSAIPDRATTPDRELTPKNDSRRAIPRSQTF
jgi:hypothetical protein